MSVLIRSKSLGGLPVSRPGTFIGPWLSHIGQSTLLISATRSRKSPSNRNCIFLYTNPGIRLACVQPSQTQSNPVKVNQSKSNQIKHSQPVPVRMEGQFRAVTSVFCGRSNTSTQSSPLPANPSQSDSIRPDPTKLNNLFLFFAVEVIKARWSESHQSGPLPDSRNTEHPRLQIHVSRSCRAEAWEGGLRFTHWSTSPKSGWSNRPPSTIVWPGLDGRED